MLLTPNSVPAVTLSTPKLDCPMCDHPNPVGSRFCNACGVPVHLVECPHCDAVNDVASPACYKCAQPLSSFAADVAEPLSTPITAAVTTPSERETGDAMHEPAANFDTQPLTPLTAVEPPTGEPAVVPQAPDRGGRIDLLSEPALHYVGGLTAPADEAELDVADSLAQRQALRGRRLGWAIAALLVMPSMIATTVYALEHRGTVERFLTFARALVPVPVGSAPSAQQEGTAPSTSLDAASSPNDISNEARATPPSANREDSSEGSLRAAGERESTAH